jgi:hypothetical protein
MPDKFSFLGTSPAEVKDLFSISRGGRFAGRYEFRGSTKGLLQVRQIRYRQQLYECASKRHVERSSAIVGSVPVPADLPPEHLALAFSVGGTKVSLRFADGFICTIDLTRLGIDTTKLRMDTARASWGSAVEIETTRGKTIHIDSSVLRAYCDPVFAAKLAQVIAAL